MGGMGRELARWGPPAAHRFLAIVLVPAISIFNLKGFGMNGKSGRCIHYDDLLRYLQALEGLRKKMSMRF